MIINWLADSLYAGTTGLLHLLSLLPWPTADDWFRWFIFLILGKLVWFVISSRLSPRRRNYSRRVSENGAAASVGSLFEHH